MYSLRFDDGVTSAGFLLTPRGVASLQVSSRAKSRDLHLGSLSEEEPAALWTALLERYPSIGEAFGGATALMPIGYLPCIQHRLTKAAGERWAMLPHAYAFVDPLFSTGIAWGLRAVERLALAFEEAAPSTRAPDLQWLARYDAQLSAEADQIDLVVAGAYEAMAHFDLFAAQAMLYFGAVSFAEVSQRLAGKEPQAWKGFLGVGDPVLGPLPRESISRLRQITRSRGEIGTSEERVAFARWIEDSLAPRNVAGLAEASKRNLYPVDFDVLIERHALLRMSRDELVAALPALRGMSREPEFRAHGVEGRSISRSARRSPVPAAPAPR
jgi:FADH2 O2-dependent halogenase